MTLWISGLLLLVGGIVLILYSQLESPHSALRAAWRSYTQTLERDIRLIFLRTTGARIAMSQLVAAAFVALAAAALDEALWLLFIPVIAILPRKLLRRARKKRVERVEHQLNGWLLMLANMLKATASLGDALRASMMLVRPPLAQEVDLICKELRLGTPMDQALGNMDARLESRLVASALTTMIVGRRTGGELPQLLETAAGALRELIRLEGVVRTKTAEARAQLTALVLIPIGLVFAFAWVEPRYFAPLLESSVGNVVIGLAGFLWILAFVTARRILAVDL
jgi:tight adherence protein B